MKPLLTLALLSVITLLAAPVGAQTLTFEGSAAGADDRLAQPIRDQRLDMAFAIYEGDGARRPAWREDHPGVAVAAGHFTVVLGAETPFPAGLFASERLYLEQIIDGRATPAEAMERAQDSAGRYGR